MSSEQSFVDFIVEQIRNVGSITYKKMFGEYALYCDGKIFALVCDNNLFIKPTKGGETFIGNVSFAPPYPSAKDYFLIEDKIEDREWLSDLVRITVKELPVGTLKGKIGKGKKETKGKGTGEKLSKKRK